MSGRKVFFLFSPVAIFSEAYALAFIFLYPRVSGYKSVC